jgi:hypothetical protein
VVAGCYNFDEALDVVWLPAVFSCLVFPPDDEFVGEWLSLVEHLVRDQGVGGSNPLSPTNLFKQMNSTSGFPSTAL